MSFTEDVRIKTPSSGILKDTPMGGIMGGGTPSIPPIFYADYDNAIDAISSNGSKTATLTSSRGSSNPATYIDADGIMQKTEVSDTPRYTSKYYDITGLQDYGKTGVIIESQRTNYLIHSIFNADDGGGNATGWDKNDDETNAPTTSLVDVSSLFNVGGTVNSQRIELTFSDGAYFQFFSDNTAVGSFVQDDIVTVSVLLKGTLSAGITLQLGIIERDAAGVSGTSHLDDDLASDLSSTEWRKFTYTVTCADADASRLSFRYFASNASATDTIDIQIANAQVEKNSFPTSFIPTTVAALTRNTEVLSYAISNNRNVAVETCIVKIAPFYASDTSSANAWITDTDTKQRYMYIIANNDILAIRPNATDSADCKIVDLVNTAWDAHDFFTLGFNIQHSSPYIEGFYQGLPNGTNETDDDFTNNAWGTNFYIGSSGSANQLNGIVFEVAFFDRLLTAGQHKQSYLGKLNTIS